jgi:formyltetrahydrofolate synthetase
VAPPDLLHAEVSAPAVVSVGPFAAASAGASAIHRFALSGVPLSVHGWWRRWVTTTGGTKTIGGAACQSDHLKN